MRSHGLIAIERSIFEHPLFLGREDRLVAWQWLIAEAAWKPEIRRGSFGFVQVQRGQLAASVRSLAKDWRWSKSKADRFLRCLVRHGMICIGKPGTPDTPGTALIHEVSIITICNYEKFQNPSTTLRKQPGHYPAYQPGQQTRNGSAFAGLSASEQENKRTKDKGLAEESREKRRGKTKPRHGARGRGDTIWCDCGTSDWAAYAADYEAVKGVAPLPKDRIGGKGRWFKVGGEGSGSV